MQRVSYGDISLFTVGGDALLNFFDAVTISIESASVDGKTIPYRDSQPEFVGTSVKIDFSVKPTIANVGRMSNLHILGLSYNAVAYQAHVIGGEFDFSYTQKEGKAEKDIWACPNNVSRTISGKSTLLIPTGAYHALVNRFVSGVITDRYVAHSLTLNSSVLTLPVMLKSYQHVESVDELTKVEVSWEGRKPVNNDAYPTAATNLVSGSLMHHAVNTWVDPVTVEFEGSATAGESLSVAGDYMLSMLRIRHADGELVKLEASLASFGPQTIGATA